MAERVHVCTWPGKNQNTGGLLVIKGMLIVLIYCHFVLSSFQCFDAVV